MGASGMVWLGGLVVGAVCVQHVLDPLLLVLLGFGCKSFSHRNVLLVSDLLGLLLYWLAVPEAMLYAVFDLSTKLASSSMLLWCDPLELPLCPGSTCADVSHDSLIIARAALNRSVQDLVVKLLGMLSVAPVGVVLVVPGSLTDSIGHDSDVLPRCM